MPSKLHPTVRQTTAYLQAQARLLAFMDCFHVLGVITLLAAPLVLLTRNFRASSRGGAAH
jgi:DHA2 family multidrug resistance protein